jgi:hypothetical protein
MNYSEPQFLNQGVPLVKGLAESLRSDVSSKRFSFASDFRVVAFLFVKMSQRDSRSMSCVRNRRPSC